MSRGHPVGDLGIADKASAIDPAGGERIDHIGPCGGRLHFGDDVLDPALG